MRLILMLKGLSGTAVGRYVGRWLRRPGRTQPGAREALAMFDYDASDDPC